MKADELKTKSEDELKKALLDARRNMMNLRFQKAGGTLEDVSQLRKTRRAIARIKTFLGSAAAATETGQDKKGRKGRKETGRTAGKTA